MPNINDLAKTYQDFITPLVQIKVNGTEIDNETLLINKVICELTSGYEASYCSIEIEPTGNKYKDNKGLSINNKIDVFKLGLKLEVLTGYAETRNLKPIFVGYITQIELTYDGRDKLIYQIEAMDFKVFMMNSKRSESKSDVKKYSDAVNAVLDKYSSLNDGVSIEATSEELIVPIEQFNESDYEFVLRIAKKLNYLFFVVNGKVIFKSQSSLKENCLSISPGPYLMNFKRVISLNEQIKKVKVVNNDESDPTKTIEGSADNITTVGKGSKSASDISNVIGNNMEKIIVDHEATSVALANARAKAELESLSMKFASGEFELIGVPDVVPGKFVTVDLLEDTLNNDYFITQVIHEFTQSRYRTFCKFNVNKV